MTPLFQNTIRELRSLETLLDSHESLCGLKEKVTERLNYCCQPLSVLVAGPFNSGKSTLINCLLGQDFLPSSVVPTTSVPIWLSYGDHLHIDLCLKNGEREVLQYDQMKELASESNVNSPVLHQSPMCIKVKFPCQLLKHITIVDSPGLHSLYDAHNDHTYRLAKDIDAILWVTPASQSASASECEDVKKLQGRLQPLVIANQIDLIDEADECMYVLDRIKMRFDLKSNLLLGISASETLHGIENSSDKKVMMKSGWTPFIDHFTGYFLPLRNAQRFTHTWASIWSICHEIDEQLNVGLNELRSRELVSGLALEKVQQAYITVTSLEAEKSTWMSVSANPPDIVIPVRSPQWLSTVLTVCNENINHAYHPASSIGGPLSKSRTNDTSTASLIQVKETTQAHINTLEQATLKLENMERQQLSLEVRLEERWQSLEHANVIIKPFLFTKRRAWKIDYLKSKTSRLLLDNEFYLLTIRIEELVTRVNTFCRDCTKLQTEMLIDIEKSIDEARDNHQSAQIQFQTAKEDVTNYEWTRAMHNEYFNGLLEALLEAAVEDLAGSKELFEPIAY